MDAEDSLDDERQARRLHESAHFVHRLGAEGIPVRRLVAGLLPVEHVDVHPHRDTASLLGLLQLGDDIGGLVPALVGEGLDDPRHGAARLDQALHILVTDVSHPQPGPGFGYPFRDVFQIRRLPVLGQPVQQATVTDRGALDRVRHLMAEQ